MQLMNEATAASSLPVVQCAPAVRQLAAVVSTC